MADISKINVSSTDYDVKDTTARNKIDNLVPKSTQMLKGNGSGGIVAATAGTDYLKEVPIATNAKIGGVKPVTKSSAMTQPVGIDSTGALYTAPSTGSVTSVDGQTGAVTTNAVKYTTQSLTTAQKAQARSNIGAGTSSFDGDYNSLTNKPTIPDEYTLPVATNTVLGGVMPVAKTTAMTQSVGVDSSGRLYTSPGGGSGSASEPFYVNCTISGRNVYDENVTHDKTYEEIVSAYNAGRPCYALVKIGAYSTEYVLQLVDYGPNINVNFAYTKMDSGDTPEVIDIGYVSVYSSDSADGYLGDRYTASSINDFLPTVTTTDNDKILRVVNGVWSKTNSDLSLGITGATVGQIAKITAVDENGKPTAWEAVDMPSGGGSPSSALICDITLAEAAQAVSQTLEHNFYALHCIVNCGTSGVALLVDADGTAQKGYINMMLDTTAASFNIRKYGAINYNATAWKSYAIHAIWSPDRTFFEQSQNEELSTGTSVPVYHSFGGTTAMKGTLGADALSPDSGRTVNIVAGANTLLNAGVRVIIWGEYYE